MKLEYQHGVRITPQYHEMSALEAAIYRYEQMAEKHYSLSNKNLNITKEQRELKLKESLHHLKNERRLLESINDVQTRLDIYRKEGELAVMGNRKQAAKAARAMAAENHHPTKTLESFMRAEGVPKPSSNHTAHHILPGKGQYRQMEVSRARLHMHLNGIRINDPANGVYLVTIDANTPHWSMPNSRGHLKYHTEDYEAFVSEKVSAFNGQDHIKTRLQVIGRILQDNEPKVAINKINSA